MGFSGLIILVLPCFPREIEQYKYWDLRKGLKSQRKFLPSSCACIFLPLYAEVLPIYADNCLYFQGIKIVFFHFTRDLDLLLKVGPKKSLKKL